MEKILEVFLLRQTREIDARRKMATQAVCKELERSKGFLVTTLPDPQHRFGEKPKVRIVT